jgi:hypothetical protein
LKLLLLKTSVLLFGIINLSFDLYNYEMGDSKKTNQNLSEELERNLDSKNSFKKNQIVQFVCKMSKTLLLNMFQIM